MEDTHEELRKALQLAKAQDTIYTSITKPSRQCPCLRAMQAMATTAPQARCGHCAGAAGQKKPGALPILTVRVQHARGGLPKGLLEYHQ